MSEQKSELNVQAASVSDRGLSEKRPLNEDSFLADAKRRFFAVADGVGGAQAGEVASQTAMEVLDEAFRHQTVGTDVEDLMEIAIQRANSSIHRMSHEHPKLSMMATTIVALHLGDRVATIGHVGDSRLYRLTPDGTLHRETQDHSVVEEEVRAGRMTPEQAARHPSRNVISRALGAEEAVEVDLKTIEVQDGTSFLLCSDGITRHISDDEIRDLLSRGGPLDAICQELKRRCYERGAEDNLTAVVVAVNSNSDSVTDDHFDDERTISVARQAVTVPLGSVDGNGLPAPTAPNDIAGQASAPQLPPSPPGNSTAEQNAIAPPQLSYLPPVQRPAGRSIVAGAAWTLLSLLLMAVAAAGGFIFGKHRGESDAELRAPEAAIAATPTPTPIDKAALFEQKRREVDSHPQVMLKQMIADSGGKPLDSNDPEQLFLYGRALLLTGKPQEASEALKKAAEGLQDRSGRDPIRVDARLSGAVAALKTGNWQAAQTASKELEEVMQREDENAAGPVGPSSSP
jgi:serine/threonine protein phosphatase PrpC